MSPLRKRRGPVKRSPYESAPDPRIFGRFYRGRPWVLGLIVFLVIAIGVYLAFAKRIPFTGHGYELHATFENAATLKPNSPVRIAGVTVGSVVSVDRGPHNTADATFTVSSEGQPVNKDATLTIRPRLFLEGNFFLDLHPGSPSAPNLESGATIPVTQTATAVQLDQVLTSLQAPERAGLKRALEGYGTALTHVPTAKENATQDPAVQGKTAAEALNQTFRYGGKAGRSTAIVNEALLGEHPHDLSNLIASTRNVFAKLASDEESLKGLITNFDITAGALASESNNLSASVHELAPTLKRARPALLHLNHALPPLRALSIELRPGIRELPATIRAGSPWLVQTRKLLRPGELGNDAKTLAAAAPGLAKTAHTSLRLFPQIGLTSRCVSHNLIPTGNEVINDQGSVTVDGTPYSWNFNPSNQPNFREFFYGTVQLAGESQGFDGNGSYVRFQAGGGSFNEPGSNPPNSGLVEMANPNGGFQNTALFGHNISPPLGTHPRLPTAGKPPFRMDVPCYQNAVPNLNGPAANLGPASPSVIEP